MTLLREYIRNLLTEKEEERSDLEKIQDLFFFETAAYALEMAEMIGLPDGPELQAMKEAVKTIEKFLTRFQFPKEAELARDRQGAQRRLYNDMDRLIKIATPQHYKVHDYTGAEEMYDDLGRAYVNVATIFWEKQKYGAGENDTWLHRVVKNAATWSGAPMPEISEEWSTK